MECPFCHQSMYSIDNGSPPPCLSVIWVCHNCPQEVRVLSEKDVEEEQHWLTRTLSIFVNHKDKQYCLLWDYVRKQFGILDVRSDAGSGPVFLTSNLPTGITPDNALDKLKIFITFM